MTNIAEYITNEFYWLHENPELAYEEYETTKRIKQALSANNIKILDLPLKTGLVAEIGSGHSPVIALRCDIDALPIVEETNLPYKSKVSGKMHACGHDFHTAAVLGATLLLNETDFNGTIRIIFQPAEESPGGAKLILNTGILCNVDLIIGLHVTPRLPVGTLGLRAGAVTASVDHFKIRFVGQGTHAAHPDKGIDPIVTAASFVSATQTIVSRNINPASANLVSITHIEGGNTWNVIPDSVFLEGTTRSLSNNDRAFIKNRLNALAENIAAAHGTTAEINWIEGPPATNNDANWINFANEVAADMHFNVVMPEVSLAGEDFAFYQEHLTGMFILIGTGLSASNHNPKFQVDLNALFPTSKFLTQLSQMALKKLQ